LCGVNLLPHEIITTPLRKAVVIAKLSPEGNLLWHKSICGTYSSSYAHNLCQMGDTAFMVKVGIELPFDVGYGQYNNLYYLDTLLTGNNDYLMSTDSIGEYIVNAFITFGYDGDVIEQHFLCVGWQDTNGNTLTPLFLGQNTMDKMFCNMFSSETFNIDSEGNIYVIRTSNDRKFNPDNGQVWSVVDGTIGALKIMVDGVHALYYYLTQRSALWNQQIFKFSPHFDSLIAAVYVFDSTNNQDPNTTIKVHDFKIDSIGNVFINLQAINEQSPLSISNSDSLIVDMSAWIPTMMLKYSPNLQASAIVQLSYAGDSSSFVVPNIIYSLIDNKNNSIYLSGNVNWPSSISVDGVTYGDDTLNLSRHDAYWIRLDKDNLRFLSYGKARAGEVGEIYELKLTTHKNRVFGQTIFSTSINFNDHETNIPNTDDNAFLIWDNEGNELFLKNFNSFSLNNSVSSPNIIDSVVYLPGTLYSNATFDTITTQSWGHSYAYIAKYVDPEFMVPYLPESERLAQSIEWDQELQLSLADSTVALTATSTSGLPVKFACSDTNIARVVGSTLHLLSEGDALVTASQPGNSQYRPADPVTKLLHISSTGIAQGERPVLAVYPNPARDAVYYTSSEQVEEIKAITSTGIVVDVPFSGGKVDISTLPNGVYYMTIVTEGSIYKHKIIKL
nr:T9SS type A sorting domain-containing protein [Bacteroidales bacterium]